MDHESRSVSPERHGVIVVDKPSGMTSARVVGKVKRALGIKKVGHTGTLDPMATGVLPLCIGEGTKIAGYLLAADKSYEGEFLLGVETDTLDREGQVVAENPEAAAAVQREQVLAAIDKLTGAQMQVPPMFSAIKKDGQRLHKLARQGVEVERESRAITVFRFELLSFAAGRGRFAVHVSKGTYVRSLVLDLGRLLGCGAHLTQLRRTQAGSFDLDMAVTLDELESGGADLRVIDPAEAVAHLLQVRTPSALASAVGDGKRLEWRLLSDQEEPEGAFALLTPSGESLLAIAVIEEEKLRYRRVFNYGLTRDPESFNVPAEIE
jgi:tRNA pseudouridine55 synthase